MSKLSTVLEKSKIDPRRVIATSKKIEGLRPEDRRIKMARKLAKKPEAKDDVKERATAKPRSGRAVSPPTLAAALRGEKVGRVARARITRAVNKILEQKKKEALPSSELF